MDKPRENKIDKSWNLVNLPKRSSKTLSSKLIMEDVSDAVNCDDILSNTSSDESDLSLEVNSSIPRDGNISKKKNRDDVLSTSILKDKSMSVKVSSCTSSCAQNQKPKIWQIVILSSVITLVVFCTFQKFTGLYFFSQPDRLNSRGSLSVNPDDSILNELGFVIPYHEVNTKKFIVDFKNRIAYPFIEPEDYIPTKFGKKAVGKLFEYQLKLSYKIYFDWIPQCKYRYNYLMECMNRKFGPLLEPYCNSLKLRLIRTFDKLSVIKSGIQHVARNIAQLATPSKKFYGNLRSNSWCRVNKGVNKAGCLSSKLITIKSFYKRTMGVAGAALDRSQQGLVEYSTSIGHYITQMLDSVTGCYLVVKPHLTVKFERMLRLLKIPE